ncbi:MAG: diacylglycerol kinase [Flavobacteriaceae bacterium CG_4_8_14_3_um_filter_34_10]|nr:diacylglycerol kinase family protein [Flavobacteriia bacterium]OIP52459.1 MAG: diacylglycerol kinase [Flavobacteriaceae bacterium CG2_30_34_30]PIQ18276.1 MAG: diacylglycerol kinase [Flavobacteriaceae bacterium CG18_big_fil_WC_8_21_14_2_50_34_36]PIX08987.1 MAG: diacylglycerol kinase [Flavobacteriaceae bacterium CG_4_8_14_3_um_filter_34_10]PIZ07242.1 MAG: diacylglycerol kinase [Flavobacteriaceae bacterium CG_4_10_14_0_8_um_filter_34_31]PJC07904.1 MAG: diacylglycerol kinase [Flavobacteriaceae 
MQKNFFVNRIVAFKYAIRGAWLLLKKEASIQVHFAIAILITLAGLYFAITPTEWMLQCLAIGLVLSIEGVNTAIEEIANFVHPKFHNKIGFIKDIAAGAVFFAAFIALIIGVLIYTPYLYQLF